ncbi:MAG: hypothetical protein JST06_00360 [Bacteroidetes bacterium]|nr:hypothetical protein [Bacteroidota bacterium]MBS1629941.1 hypothetical protein [Bacteroidota bacterium]
MKCIFLSIVFAWVSYSSLSAQNIDVINNTTCAVNVTLMAFETVKNPCTVAGATGPVYIPPFSTQTFSSSSWAPTPPGYPYSYSGAGYAWLSANVGISNPSPGYEYSTDVCDPSRCSLGFPSATLWYNPTCGINLNISFVPGSLTTNAQVIINP